MQGTERRADTALLRLILLLYLCLARCKSFDLCPLHRSCRSTVPMKRVYHFYSLSVDGTSAPRE